MTILQDNLFKASLHKILYFIVQDSKLKASKFNNALFKQINNLPNYPYKCRQSFHYDDTQVRDMIFKGYTIPYLIDDTNNTIIILNIFKWMNK